MPNRRKSLSKLFKRRRTKGIKLKSNRTEKSIPKKTTPLVLVLKIWASHSVETLDLELKLKNKLIKTRQNNSLITVRNKSLPGIQLILAQLLRLIMSLRKTCFLVSMTGPMLKVQLFCQPKTRKRLINKSNQFSNRKTT